MNPYPPAEDPTSAAPAGAAPLYVDPVTGQQLYVDPVTGALTYPAQEPPPGGSMPGGASPNPAYPSYGPPAFPTSGAPGYGQPDYGTPAYGTPGLATPGLATPGFAAPGYGYPTYVYPGTRGTNGLAIGSMVVSIVGALTFWCYGLGGVFGLVGAILGHVALHQVRSHGDQGRGMAIAGVVIGWLAVALAIGVLILIGWFANRLANDPTFAG